MRELFPEVIVFTDQFGDSGSCGALPVATSISHLSVFPVYSLRN